MNCWRFDARIFDACRDVPRSARGELELPEAVGLAVAARRAVQGDPRPRPGARSLAPRGRRRRRATAGGDGAAAMTGADARRRAGRARTRSGERERAKADALRRGPRRVPATSPARRPARRLVGARTARGLRQAHRLRGRPDAGVRRAAADFAVAARPRADGSDPRGRRGARRSPDPPRRRSRRSFTGWRHYVAVAARRLAAQLSRRAARRRHRLRQRSAARLRHEQLQRAGRRASRRRWCGRPASRRGPSGAPTSTARSTWPATSRASRTACRSARLQGDAGVGTHGGSEDHAAILGGHAGAALGVRVRADAADRAGRHAGRLALRARGERRPIVEDRQRPGRVQPAWRAARRCCSRSGTRRSRGPCRWARRWHPAARSRSGRWSARSAVDGWPPDVLERRLEHFIREDRRVPDAVDAFGAGDVDRADGAGRRRPRRTRRVCSATRFPKPSPSRARRASWAPSPPAASARDSAAASGRWSIATPAGSPGAGTRARSSPGPGRR